MPVSRYDWSGVPIPASWPMPAVTAIMSGARACFTRPEHKSERVSYSVITPTAAAGALESTFWKPEFRYVITQVDVLAPLKWTTVRVNETGAVISSRNPSPIDTTKARQQRTNLLLADVSYRVHAQILVHPDSEHGNPAKFRDQLRRRLARGQNFRTPYFGMREMVADLEPDRPEVTAQPWTESLGVMLHNITRDATGQEAYGWFDARVVEGSMHIPATPLLITGGDRAAAGAR